MDIYKTVLKQEGIMLLIVVAKKGDKFKRNVSKYFHDS